MGQSVKLLIDHLRQREAEFGVNAFKFNRILVSGVPVLQPAQYPPEAEEVIAAGSSVRNWPRAADIPIALSMMRIDDEAEIAVDNMDILGGSHSEEAPNPVTGVPLTTSVADTDIVDDHIQQQSLGATSTPNVDPIRGEEVEMKDPDTVPSQEIVARDSVIHLDAPVMASSGSTGPLLQDCMDSVTDNKPNATDPPGKNQSTAGSMEGASSTIAAFNFNTVSHTPMQFPPQPGGMPFYFPPSQDMRIHPVLPHMASNMGHPFMGSMGQEQWGMLMQYPYYAGQNGAVPSIPVDPPKSMIDPTLPPGPPPFSVPYPQQNQEYLSRPPMVSQFQGNPFLVARGSPAPVFPHHQIGAPLPAFPPVNIPPTPLDGTKIIPPKGTPSPKKSSPRKRGRGQAVDEAEAKTPSRNRKRIS